MKLDQKKSNVRNTGNVLLYDFDSVTGAVSNGITLISNSNPYGVEFSSKTKKLYVTENHFDSGGDKIVESVLIQFDLKNTNIPSSKTVIETSPLYIRALQLAIDEKIYGQDILPLIMEVIDYR
jgi:DNA-binding beta-propeller fold protein YncE